MKEIVEALKKRISENKNSMLVTVVAGRGSIPRKAGAYMVVGEDGRVTGTIGGGNLEYQATPLGQNFLRKRKIICMSIILVRKICRTWNGMRRKCDSAVLFCGCPGRCRMDQTDGRGRRKKRSILDPDAVRGRENKNTARVSDFCASVCDRNRWSTFLCRTVFL